MLWLIGNGRDTHIRALESAFERRGIKHIVAGREATPIAFASNLRDPVGESDVVLWRYKFKSGSYITSYDMAVDRFTDVEWHHFLMSMCLRSKATILNGPPQIFTAGIKPNQLQVASRVGFKIPRFCIASSKSTLLAFMDEVESDCFIKKPLYGDFIPDPVDMQESLIVTTSRITRDEVASFDDEMIACCPVLIQQEIKKSFELRIVAVGNSVVTFRIDSQSLPETSLDWRIGQFCDIFVIEETHPNLREKILNYLRDEDLFSGVFDFAIDEDGSAFFFECNPNGQWQWLDPIAPGLIPDMFADAIASKFPEVLL